MGHDAKTIQIEWSAEAKGKVVDWELQKLRWGKPSSASRIQRLLISHIFIFIIIHTPPPPRSPPPWCTGEEGGLRSHICSISTICTSERTKSCAYRSPLRWWLWWRWWWFVMTFLMMMTGDLLTHDQIVRVWSQSPPWSSRLSVKTRPALRWEFWSTVHSIFGKTRWWPNHVIIRWPNHVDVIILMLLVDLKWWPTHVDIIILMV